MEKTTYALLIYRTAAGDVEPACMEQVLEGHRALQGQADVARDLAACARLDGVGTAKSVRRGAEAHEVTDGPFIDTKEWLAGFYLLECVDEAEALSRARTLCPLPDHAVEVRPVLWKRET